MIDSRVSDVFLRSGSTHSRFNDGWLDRVQMHWLAEVPNRSSRLLLLSLAVVVLGSPALAGSATAGSIISKADAIATAASGMPPGQVITAERCLTMVRDLSPRYSCTVTWTDPPQRR